MVKARSTRLTRQDHSKLAGYECLLFLAKLMVERQENAVILGTFAGGEHPVARQG